MIKLESHIRKIISLCKALSVRKLDLIGSAARDDFKENSDIDVLVVFDGDMNLFDRYFELKENLEKIFGRSVDIVMEEAIKNPIFRKSINQDRVLLYAA
ncbi:MAG TPA: nucleotidyltransferase [Flavobacterium sp.]|nr:nucleotidyltransferase [Flavobacterium sp.]